VRDIAFSADGTQLATCGEDRKVVLSRTNGQPMFELPRQGAKVMTLVFCGQDQLATAGSDNVVRIWDLTTRTETAALTGHTGTVAVLAFHSDMLVSTGFDTTVRVWTRQQKFTGGDPVAPRRVGARPQDAGAR
jgi:WD40 repeat protein